MIYIQVFVGSEGTNLLQLDTPCNMKKIRVFYIEGLKTPLVQDTNEESFRTLKKESNFND